MKELINRFAKQLRSAIKIDVNSKFSANKREIRNIVISGMGESGIGGNIVCSLSKETIKVSVEVVKDYSIPNN